MGVVPVTISGVIYPKNKKDPAEAVTIVGSAWVTGLGVGGGPIEPPAMPEVPPGIPAHPIFLPPLPPDGIWGPGDPRPTPPIYIPEPPPELPPTNPGSPKPPPPEGGWGWHPDYGWGYFPGPGQPGPKKG